MQPPQVLMGKLQDRIAELKALRDEIRLDLHLANMELKSEWKDLEKRLPDPAVAAEQLKDVTTEAIEKLTAQIRAFRARLGRADEAEGKDQVKGLMSTDVATCAPTDSLARAVAVMWERDVGCLPVVGQDGKVVGAITDRDAAIAACTRGKRMDDMSVESVMSKDVAFCRPQDGVDQALALMRSRQVRRLPVVNDSGTLVGLVTLNDAARASAREPAELIATLAAVTEPRSASLH